jgi:hypothetical protein
MCYESPEKCTVNFLLDLENRTILADAVNSAILKMEKALPDSPLELICRQIAVAHQELLDVNVGSAAFIKLDDFFS